MFARLSLVQRTMLSLILGGLIGCNSLANLGVALPYLGEPPLSTIAKLKDQPKGSIVVIQGTVSKYVPFIGSAAYQIQDKTGTVWIKSTNPLPQSGQNVIVKAKVDFQSIEVASQELGEIYLLELEQLEPTEQPQVKPKPKKAPTNDLFLPHKNL